MKTDTPESPSTKPDDGNGAAVVSHDWLGVLSEHATDADIEAEKRHYDESTPFEIVAISALLKGLEEYAQDTANEQMMDGFTGEDASYRALCYHECRERLTAYWSRES